MAHIGVLRALMENEVPIDFIAGSSAGALVGGVISLECRFPRSKQSPAACAGATLAA